MNLNKKQMAYLEENYGKSILPLSSFENEDQIGLDPIEVLLYYKKDWTFEEYAEAFQKAAHHFNLFSSRLIMIDDNKFALHYCTDGVDFHHLPSMDSTFDNINIDDVKKKIVKVKTLPGEPLLALTGIQIKDGWLGGVTCSHAVADGISLTLFLSIWGSIIEGMDVPPPSPQRLFKGNPVSSDKIDKVFTPPLCELSDKIQDRVKSNMRRYIKREYFTDEFLQENKNKAKLENEKYIISSNQIITAFLIKKYHDVMLPDTDRIRLRSPINLRDVNPDIDPMYIGNAFLDLITEFTKDEINKMSIPQIAYRLKESINNARSENYIRKITFLSKYGEVEFNTDMIKDYSLINKDTDIVSSNLTHLSDLGTLGIGPDKGSFVNITTAVPTGFLMLKEQSGRIFVDITSRYPLT